VVFEARTFEILSESESQARNLIEALQTKKILKQLVPSEIGPSSLKTYSYTSELIDPHNRRVSVGGASIESKGSALTALAAEAMERYVWSTQGDYFVDPITARASEVADISAYISPERFVSFSKEQREVHPALRLSESGTYAWIRSTSLVTGTQLYIPAQTVSATVSIGTGEGKETLIRQNTTTGLATWPTQEGARLRGILEIIEREAYMVMWFNQLTLPRIQLSSLRGMSPTLDKLVEACAKDGLSVHTIKMITDAPTHAVCVVLEDTSGAIPQFAFGLKAHPSIAYSIEKALIEALRGRFATRLRSTHPAPQEFDVDTIGHRERILYWAAPERATGLSFLIQGPEIAYEKHSWDADSDEAHLERLLGWCRTKDFECVAISLDISQANITPWHIEMIVMPDLHPMHLNERFRHLDTRRLHEVPMLYGYTPRSEPFVDAPHPFS